MELEVWYGVTFKCGNTMTTFANIEVDEDSNFENELEELVYQDLKKSYEVSKDGNQDIIDLAFKYGLLNDVDQIEIDSYEEILEDE